MFTFQQACQTVVSGEQCFGGAFVYLFFVQVSLLQYDTWQELYGQEYYLYLRFRT